MNVELLNIVNRIVAEYGEDILAASARLKPIFSDYAKSEHKEDRVAFGRCIEYGAYQELKKTSAADERRNVKAALADQVNAKTGIEKARCADALDLLEAVIFKTEQQSFTTPSQTRFCKNCGKELQKGWEACPYCSTPAKTIDQSGIRQVKPETPVFSNNAASQTQQPVQNAVDLAAGCDGCYCKKTTKKGINCDYFSCGISEAIGYYCGMKTSDTDYQILRQKKQNKFNTGASLVGGLLCLEIVLAIVAIASSGWEDGLTIGFSSVILTFVFWGAILGTITEKRKKNAKRLSR